MSKISSPFLNYENQWVALTPRGNKVLASGSTVPELEKKLKGVSSKRFVLTFIPPFDKVLSLNAK